MTDEGHAVELLLAIEPDASGMDRIIAELQQVPISGSLKRKVFGEWASAVGASPTKYDFERASRMVVGAKTPGATT